MNEDLIGVTTLGSLFGLTLVLFGLLLAATGNKELLPARAMRSVRTKDDVRRIGRYVMIIGAILLVVAITARLLFG